jgi:hypothetical protein
MEPRGSSGVIDTIRRFVNIIFIEKNIELGIISKSVIVIKKIIIMTRDCKKPYFQWSKRVKDEKAIYFSSCRCFVLAHFK